MRRVSTGLVSKRRCLLSTRGAAVPLLVVRRGLPAAEALPLVMRFLAGEGADGSGTDVVAATG